MMNTAQHPPAFDVLAMPAAALPPGATSRYRVYKEAGKYVYVDALSAAEALRTSGIAAPIRIKREVPGNQVLVLPSEFADTSTQGAVAPSSAPTFVAADAAEAEAPSA